MKRKCMAFFLVVCLLVTLSPSAYADGPVAKIERAGVDIPFSSLAAAITGAVSGETIILLEDAQLEYGDFRKAGLTIDGKGFKIQVPTFSAANNNIGINIPASSTIRDVTFEYTGTAPIGFLVTVATANVTLDGVTIGKTVAGGTGQPAGVGLQIHSTANAVINDLTITADCAPRETYGCIYINTGSGKTTEARFTGNTIIESTSPGIRFEANANITFENPPQMDNSTIPVARAKASLTNNGSDFLVPGFLIGVDPYGTGSHDPYAYYATVEDAFTKSTSFTSNPEYLTATPSVALWHALEEFYAVDRQNTSGVTRMLCAADITTNAIVKFFPDNNGTVLSQSMIFTNANNFTIQAVTLDNLDNPTAYVPFTGDTLDNTSTSPGKITLQNFDFSAKWTKEEFDALFGAEFIADEGPSSSGNKFKIDTPVIPPTPPTTPPTTPTTPTYPQTTTPADPAPSTPNPGSIVGTGEVPETATDSTSSSDRSSSYDTGWWYIVGSTGTSTAATGTTPAAGSGTVTAPTADAPAAKAPRKLKHNDKVVKVFAVKTEEKTSIYTTWSSSSDVLLEVDVDTPMVAIGGRVIVKKSGEIFEVFRRVLLADGTIGYILEATLQKNPNSATGSTSLAVITEDALFGVMTETDKAYDQTGEDKQETGNAINGTVVAYYGTEGDFGRIQDGRQLAYAPITHIEGVDIQVWEQ